MWSTTSGGRRTRCALAASRARWRIASLSACSALAVAAGCGGATTNAIPAGTADALAQRSDLVAAALERGDRCGADRLADELVSASTTAQLPSRYRAPLVGAAQSLADEITCPPPPPPPAEPAATPKPEEPKEHAKHGKHDKRHGHDDNGDEQ